jgi:hypothetical protein
MMPPSHEEATGIEVAEVGFVHTAQIIIEDVTIEILTILIHKWLNYVIVHEVSTIHVCFRARRSWARWPRRTWRPRRTKRQRRSPRKGWPPITLRTKQD